MKNSFAFADSGGRGAEIEDWSLDAFLGDDRALFWSFAGAMDEFFQFGRVLGTGGMDAHASNGEPQPDSLIPTAEVWGELSTS